MPRWLSLSAIAIIYVFAFGNHANAQVVHHTDSIPLAKTNWDKVVTVPKFPTELGTLTSVRFSLQSSIQGTLMIESLDSAPVIVASGLAAEITLKRPDGSIILVHTPGVEKINDFSVFDGVVDFTGDSGATHLIANTSTGTFLLDPLSGDDRTLFSGDGTLNLPISAEAVSSFAGGGNLDTESTLSTSAYTTITYGYVTPDLTTHITPRDNLALGQGGQVTLSVENMGAGPTTGPVTLQTTLPGGLPLSSVNTDGWSCAQESQSVTCTYTDVIPAQSFAPDITLMFGVTVSAFPTSTCVVTVSTPTDVDASNGENNTDALITINAPPSDGSGGGRE